MNLLIHKKNNLYIAVIIDENGTTKKVNQDALSERALEELLFSKGFDQRDIESAILMSDKHYFSVDKW
ncbi:MAG: hypothetical protein AB8D52_00680 [Gammaproteobacteria bacterium]